MNEDDLWEIIQTHMTNSIKLQTENNELLEKVVDELVALNDMVTEVNDGGD